MFGAPTKLIIVCCHAIWLGGPSNGTDESEWLIADFQRGETPTFMEHIKAGVRCLAEDRGPSVLMFSGGPTRKETELSEAQSYANVAVHNSYWDMLSLPVMDNDIALEERALDSYHNILFSLTLFHERFKAWPHHVTVISHAFKKPRVMDGHFAAIGYPLDQVTYIGIDPPGVQEKEDAMKGAEIAVAEWQEDPHGRGGKLAEKREKRNPWRVWQGVFSKSAGEMEMGSLMTRGEGDKETLVDDAERPWTTER